MTSSPRIIATTASVALLAAAGAGAAVVALDFVDSPQSQTELDASSTTQLPPPQDDRTTVYRAPQEDHHDDDSQGHSGQIQPAPPTTTFNGGQGQKAPNNTSKSS
jgi:hypothetical protein